MQLRGSHMQIWHSFLWCSPSAPRHGPEKQLPSFLSTPVASWPHRMKIAPGLSSHHRKKLGVLSLDRTQERFYSHAIEQLYLCSRSLVLKQVPVRALVQDRVYSVSCRGWTPWMHSPVHAVEHVRARLSRNGILNVTSGHLGNISPTHIEEYMHTSLLSQISADCRYGISLGIRTNCHSNPWNPEYVG